jgi:hypothetical protein
MEIRKRLKNALSIIKWHITGGDLPPKSVKRLIIRSYAKSYGHRVFIETGTYLGDTVATLWKLFDKTYSIELSPELYSKAVNRFAGNDRIDLCQGDSSEILPQILSTLKEPAVFWLDGHYSGGITAKGETETPVMSELVSILAHEIKDHVILIDDARCFNGTNGYPALDELKSLVQRYQPLRAVEVEADIVRITPLYE